MLVDHEIEVTKHYFGMGKLVTHPSRKTQFLNIKKTLRKKRHVYLTDKSGSMTTAITHIWNDLLYFL